MTQNYEQISRLMAKYLDGETSPREQAELELALADASELPPDLADAARMFAALAEAQAEVQIDRLAAQSRPKLWQWLGQAAAALVIIAGGAVGLLHTPDTTLAPDEAAALTQQCVGRLAMTLRKGADEADRARTELAETTQNIINKLP